MKTWLRRWAEELMPMFLAAGLLALGYAAYALAATWPPRNEQRNQYHHHIKEGLRLQCDPAATVLADRETIGEHDAAPGILDGGAIAT